mgnify:CR=1 FL=1
MPPGGIVGLASANEGRLWANCADPSLSVCAAWLRWCAAPIRSEMAVDQMNERHQAPPFVGDDRHQAVERLVAAFDRVAAGSGPELVCLVAPIGWGKTRGGSLREPHAVLTPFGTEALRTRSGRVDRTVLPVDFCGRYVTPAEQ